MLLIDVHILDTNDIHVNLILVWSGKINECAKVVYTYRRYILLSLVCGILRDVYIQVAVLPDSNGVQLSL